MPERNYSLQLCRLLCVYYMPIKHHLQEKYGTTLWWKQCPEYQLYNRTGKQSIQVRVGHQGLHNFFFLKRKWISLQMSEEKAGRLPRYSEEDMFLLSTKNPKAIGNVGENKMFNGIMVQIGSKCTYGRIMINWWWVIKWFHLNLMLGTGSFSYNECIKTWHYIPSTQAQQVLCSVKNTFI